MPQMARKTNFRAKDFERSDRQVHISGLGEVVTGLFILLAIYLRNSSELEKTAKDDLVWINSIICQ
jgi:hypothetical protein